MNSKELPAQAPVFDGDYYVVQAPMTRILKLRGYDLTVFAIIHSFTKDGAHVYRGSIRDIADKWFEGASSVRAVKDSLKALADAGYINVIKEGNRHAYTTNYNGLLEKAAAGIEIPSLGKKNRAKYANGGTVPPTVLQSIDNQVACGANGGTVPPTANGGTVPPKWWYRTTENGGTVPPQVNIDNNKSILLSAHADARAREAQEAQEEKEEIFEIFFLRNAANPRREVERFYEYNERNDWNGGRLDTAAKRARMAKVNWKFESETRRFPEDFLASWGAIHLAAKMSDPEIARAMLDDRIAFSGIPGQSCVITCPAKVVPWIEEDSRLMAKLMPLKRKYGNITYRTIK